MDENAQYVVIHDNVVPTVRNLKCFLLPSTAKGHTKINPETVSSMKPYTLTAYEARNAQVAAMGRFRFDNGRKI